MHPDDEDRMLEAGLARARERRARAARFMVLLLVVPLGLQALVVLFGIVAIWGVGAVVVPAAVIWIVRRA